MAYMIKYFLKSLIPTLITIGKRFFLVYIYFQYICRFFLAYTFIINKRKREKIQQKKKMELESSRWKDETE